MTGWPEDSERQGLDRSAVIRYPSSLVLPAQVSPEMLHEKNGLDAAPPADATADDFFGHPGGRRWRSIGILDFDVTPFGQGLVNSGGLLPD